jgi:hypothetical protein
MSKSGMNMTPAIALSGGFYLKAESDPDVIKNKQFNALYSKEFVTDIADASKTRLSSPLFAVRETFGTTNKSILRLM